MLFHISVDEFVVLQITQEIALPLCVFFFFLKASKRQ